MDFDHPDRPSIMQDFLQALGAEAVAYPYQTECCGSYLSVNAPEKTQAVAGTVLQAAARAGASWLVTSCPTCLYNLQLAAPALAASTRYAPVKVVYFTQLLAHALGLDGELGEAAAALPEIIAMAEVN